MVELILAIFFFQTKRQYQHVIIQQIHKSIPLNTQTRFDVNCIEALKTILMMESRFYNVIFYCDFEQRELSSLHIQ